MSKADPVPTKGQNFPLIHVLAGCSSGLFGAVALQPLDVIKTTMIGTFRSDQPDKPVVFRRSWDAAAYVTKTQGVTGLWRGLVPSVARVTIGAGLYFSIINLTLVKNEQDVPTKQSAALAGGLSRTISAIVLNPLTLIKTRFEAAAVTDQNYRGVIDAIVKIGKTEGIQGLYAGLIPTLIRDVPYSSINVLLFTQIKPIVHQYFAHSSATVSLVSGSISGVLGTALTHPFDVIRTRMQLKGTGEGIFSACVRTVREDGITGLFRGVGPRLFRRGLSNAMTWTIYEQLVDFYKKQLIYS